MLPTRPSDSTTESKSSDWVEPIPNDDEDTGLPAVVALLLGGAVVIVLILRLLPLVVPRR